MSEISNTIKFDKQRVPSNDVVELGEDVQHNPPFKTEDVPPANIPPIIPDNTQPPVDFKTEGLEQIMVDIEGKETTLFLNAEGNAVNEKGEVLYTKDQLEDDTTEFDVLLEKPKFEIKTDKGENKQYAKSVQGLQEYLDDVYKKGMSDTLQENNEGVFLNNLYSKYPVVKDVLDYVEKNGTIKGFNTDLDINKEPTKDDLPFLRLIVREDRIKKGETVAEADAYVDYLETQNKLFDIATSVRSKVLEDKTNSERLQAARDIEFQNSYWGIDTKSQTPNGIKDSFYDIIMNQKRLSIEGQDIAIPDVIKVRNGEASYVTKTKEDFFKYIYNTNIYNIDGKNVRMTEYAYNGYLKELKRNSNSKHYDIFEALESFIGENPFSNDSINAQTKYETTKRRIIKSSDGGGTKPNGKIKFIKPRASANIG